MKQANILLAAALIAAAATSYATEEGDGLALTPGGIAVAEGQQSSTDGVVIAEMVDSTMVSDHVITVRELDNLIRPREGGPVQRPFRSDWP